MQSALERWQALVDARSRQMDTAYAALERTSADFWDRRARNFHHATRDTLSRDSLYQRLSKQVTKNDTVLDVGAGTGRFSLALAPLVKSVTAVEPSASMLHYLRQEMTERKLENIELVPTTWEDAPDSLRADLVICSHVLYPLRNVDTFLAKLQSATRGVCYIYLRAISLDAITGHLWRHFHGEERASPPAYIHALDVLYEMGIFADVEVVSVPQSLRYPSLEVAVDELQEQLILPANEQIQQELRGLLTGWLVEREGMLTPPVEELFVAIIRMAGIAK